MQGLIAFATEAAGEEPSKLPFYLLGGLLAVYAVAVSFAGISGRAAFLASPGGRAAVMALSTLLVAGTLTAAVVTG